MHRAAMDGLVDVVRLLVTDPRVGVGEAIQATARDNKHTTVLEILQTEATRREHATPKT